MSFLDSSRVAGLADARQMLVLGLLSALVFLAALRLALLHRTRKNRNQQPSSRGVPIPNVAARAWHEPAALAFARQPYQWLFDAHARYGSAFGMSLGTFRCVWLTGPDATEAVFNADEDTLSFHKAIEPNITKLFPLRHLHQPWVNYLVGGMAHRKHSTHFAQCVLDVVEAEQAKWVRETEAIGSTDLFKASFDVMTLIITKYAFGEEFTNKHGAELCELIFAFDALMGNVDVMALPEWMFWAEGNRKLKACKTRFYEIANAELHERLAGPAELYEDRDDYLQYLIRTDRLERVEDYTTHILVIYFASTINTSTTLGWAAAHLAQSPRIQNKLRSELGALGISAESFAQARAEGTEEPLLSTLENCAYLRGITHESLRLRPPPFLVQQAMKPWRFGEHVVEKGALVAIAPPVINRDPSVFPCPDEYIPERFTDEVPADVRSANPAGGVSAASAFLPWGKGRRRCKGIKLAEQAIHTTLARLVLCHGSVGIEGEDAAAVEVDPRTGREKIVPIAPQLTKIFGPPHSAERCGLRVVGRADEL
ncbi:hypothetical protein OC844_004408 [Tilletia horrida]|nr:hypothetical protein OC844_004408 [Tilletia horrida]